VLLELALAPTTLVSVLVLMRVPQPLGSVSRLVLMRVPQPLGSVSVLVLMRVPQPLGSVSVLVLMRVPQPLGSAPRRVPSPVPELESLAQVLRQESTFVELDLRRRFRTFRSMRLCFAPETAPNPLVQLPVLYLTALVPRPSQPPWARLVRTEDSLPPQASSVWTNSV
jgi:hypothetical protein